MNISYNTRNCKYIYRQIAFSLEFDIYLFFSFIKILLFICAYALNVADDPAVSSRHSQGCIMHKCPAGGPTCAYILEVSLI